MFCDVVWYIIESLSAVNTRILNSVLDSRNVALFHLKCTVVRPQSTVAFWTETFKENQRWWLTQMPTAVRRNRTKSFVVCLANKNETRRASNKTRVGFEA